MTQTRIFFDISGLTVHLRSSGTYTGIQRTLVSILAEFCGSKMGENVFLSWLDRKSGQYKTISINAFSEHELISPVEMAQFFNLPLHRFGVFPPLRRYTKQPLKYRFNFWRCRLNALLGRKNAFKKMGSSLERWNTFYDKKSIRKDRKSVLFSTMANPRDRLILIDSNWMTPKSMQHFQAAHSSGIIVQVMIHDLIPLVYPQYQPSSMPVIFHNWLLDTTSFVSHYIANSESTRRDLEKFLSIHNASQKVTVVPLAQSTIKDLTQSDPAASVLDRFVPGSFSLVSETIEIDDRIRCLAGSSFVLCVGTIEIRKNHWRLARAWDLLSKELPSDKLPKLVIAGKRGWMANDFYDFINGTSNLYGSIAVIDGPSDRELAFLYKHCLFTVMPSLYEGWGLPVGESLSYGRTAVVSTAGALPEVGGDLVCYCDPLSPHDIMRACKDLIMDPVRLRELEEKISQARLRQWNDVAHNILEIGT